MDSFYSEEELKSLGFKSIGQNVKLSRKASVYSPEKISLGHDVRIDDFCVLSGNIRIGNYVHIAASCLLFGGNDGIVFEDYTGLSSRSAVYAESDDYSGAYFTNPTFPTKYRHVIGGGVVVKKHTIIGSGCTILPNVVIGDGCSIGAMSLINKSLEGWKMYVGIPCHYVKDRSNVLLELEEKFAKGSL